MAPLTSPALHSHMTFHAPREPANEPLPACPPLSRSSAAASPAQRQQHQHHAHGRPARSNVQARTNARKNSPRQLSTPRPRARGLLGVAGARLHAGQAATWPGALPH